MSASVIDGPLPHAEPAAAAPLPRPGAPRRVVERITTLARALADLATTLGAFLVSYRVYAALVAAGIIHRGAPQPTTYAAVALTFAGLALAVFARRGLYERRASVLNLRELEGILSGMALAAAYLFALLFFLQRQEYSRLVVVGAIALAMVLLVVERRALASVVGRLQLRGLLAQRVLIYGSGPTGHLLMKKVVQAPQLGYQVVGFLDDHAPVGSPVACRLTQTGPVFFQTAVVGRGAHWREVVARLRVHELLVAAPSVTRDRLREIIQQADAAGVRVGVIPQIEELRADSVRVDDLSAIPVLRPCTPPAHGLYEAAKRVLDLAGALLLLLLTAPVWVAAAVCIRLDSPGPVLFVQERVGLRGRRFRMVKFRTMWCDVAAHAPSPQGDVDPRITRVGRLLRTAGLDELPQLLNVLAGEMSLVGPRPEMPFIVDRYSSLERQRLEVKPGITGLWQISADRHAEIHENLEYDLYYIHHRSLAMDALILVETLLFSAGAAWRALTRRRETDARPAVLPAPVLGATRGYVLVALEQRRRETLPESWRRVLLAACTLTDRWPVKILVAPDNTEAVDRLLEDALRRPGEPPRRLEYVWCDGRAELRTLAAAADLVVTELDHVAEVAREAGRPVARIRHGVPVATELPPASAAILDALGRALRPSAPHARHPTVALPDTRTPARSDRPRPERVPSDRASDERSVIPVPATP